MLKHLGCLRLLLICLWGAGAFGVPWLARDLDASIGGWPFHLWWAAQGSLLFFLAVCLLAVIVLGRFDEDEIDV